jgi:hypothetical protein
VSFPAAAWIMLAIRFPPRPSRSAPSDEMQSLGPVVGIMKVVSDEEAIRLMHDSSYGLTASIWTEDAAAGDAIGDETAKGHPARERVKELALSLGL